MVHNNKSNSKSKSINIFIYNIIYKYNIFLIYLKKIVFLKNYMSVRKNDLDIIYIDKKIKEKFNEKYENLVNLRKILYDFKSGLFISF